MIKQIGQVMLYVNDQDQALRFWTEKVGFIKVSEADNGQGLRWIEIAPAAGLQTSFVLHNKQLIAEMQPELNLGTPSILLFADDLDTLYKDFQAKGITVGIWWICRRAGYLTSPMMRTTILQLCKNSILTTTITPPQLLWWRLLCLMHLH